MTDRDDGLGTVETGIAATAPKHGGCFRCGSIAEPVLTSVRNPGGKGAPSVAVCSGCLSPEERGA